MSQSSLMKRCESLTSVVTKEALCPQLAISTSVKIAFLKRPGRLLFSFSKANHQTEGASSYLHYLNITSHSFISGCLRLFLFPKTLSLNLPYSINFSVLASLWWTENSFPWKYVQFIYELSPQQGISACGYFVIDKEFPWTDCTNAISHWCVCWY